jgi:nucleoid-associated protein YgaU
MASRYKNRKIVKNRNELYETFLDERGMDSIRHYRTPIIAHPTSGQRRQLLHTRVLWKQGDRFWKLAAKFYGNSKLWWVIAWYNQKPTEASVEVGETLLIPRPLEKVLAMAGY